LQIDVGLAKIRKRTNARIFRFKGDKLVGNYYVVFDKVYKEEIAQLMSAGKTEEAKNKSDYSGSPRYATKMGIW
jgi:hypothetical protein